MPGRLHDPDYAILIEHLAETRRMLGMTQVELAGRLGRPQSYVSKIERSERRVDVAEWRQIVLALGKDPATMFRDVCTLLEQVDILAAPPSE